jgi:WD40 repeat protein
MTFSEDGNTLRILAMSDRGKKQGFLRRDEDKDVASGEAPPRLRRLVAALELRMLDVHGKKPAGAAPFDPEKSPPPVSFVSSVMDATLLGQSISFRVKGNVVSPMCLAPDRKHRRLAIGGVVTPDSSGPKFKQEGGVVLWDLSGVRPPHVLKGVGGAVIAVAFSPDGRRLATLGFDNTIRLWDTDTWKQQAALKGHAAFLMSVAFSGDGVLLASAAADGVIKLWEVETGQLRATFKGHTTGVSSIVLAPDGRTLLSADVDGTVKLWDTRGEPGPTRVSGFRDRVEELAFVDHGKTFVVVDLGGVTLCDAATGQMRPQAKIEIGANCAAVSPVGRAVAVGSSNRGVRIYDWTTGKISRTLVVPDWLRTLAFSPDGRLLAGGSLALQREGAVILLWDTATGKEVLRARGHGNRVQTVAFSPDGRTLASGGQDRSVKFWDVATGKELRSIPVAAKSVTCVRFSPDGRLLACASEQALTLHEVSDGRELLRMQGPSHDVVHMAFSPDGRRLATAGGEGDLGKGGGVKLWDTRSGVEVLSPGGTSDTILCVCFSPDGHRLLSASATSSFLAFSSAAITIWDGTPLP